MVLWLMVNLARLILSLRYRVVVRGQEEILARGKGGILVVSNHPALIDPIVLGTWLGAWDSPHFPSGQRTDQPARPCGTLLPTME